jgi:two-component system chemotaxis response regulator CheY
MASILAVDDSASIRQAIKIALTSEGYAVSEAGDGAEGLAKAGSAAFDLIITDLNMPVMDGVALIRALRAGPKHRSVPILMLTTESDAGKKADGKSAGATGWLVKPFDPAKLIDVVKRVSP